MSRPSNAAHTRSLARESVLQQNGLPQPAEPRHVASSFRNVGRRHQALVTYTNNDNGGGIIIIVLLGHDYVSFAVRPCQNQTATKGKQ